MAVDRATRPEQGKHGLMMRQYPAHYYILLQLRAASFACASGASSTISSWMEPPIWDDCLLPRTAALQENGSARALRGDAHAGGEEGRPDHEGKRDLGRGDVGGMTRGFGLLFARKEDI